MGSDWSECSIGDALTLQRGFDITKKEQIVGSVPVVSSGGIKSFHSHAKVKAPGVVLGRKGTLGTVFFLIEDFWPHDTTLWVKDFKGNSAHFIYYFFQNISTVLQSLDAGTSNPALNRNHVHPVDMKLPPLPEQKAIAHILGSLDDKIELNRRMNATLEGMAQALFKCWFVDFDPVIDNAIKAGNPIPEELAERAEVRRKALADGTANRKAAKQFPAAFQLTEEMGWIPVGWEVGKMSDHALIEMGQSPKGDTYNSSGEGTPLVNGPVEFGPYFTNKSKWTTSPTKLSRKGDLIVCVRGSTTGRFVKSDNRYCLGRGVCSVRGKRSQCFVDQIFKSSISEMLGLTTGSTFPNWSRQTLSGFEAIVPPDSIVDKFDEYISRKIERIEYGFLESTSLSNLRDTLLPKLISGELRIPEAEKLTKEALA